MTQFVRVFAQWDRRQKQNHPQMSTDCGTWTHNSKTSIYNITVEPAHRFSPSQFRSCGYYPGWDTRWLPLVWPVNPFFRGLHDLSPDPADHPMTGQPLTCPRSQHGLQSQLCQPKNQNSLHSGTSFHTLESYCVTKAMGSFWRVNHLVFCFIAVFPPEPYVLGFSQS